MFYRMTLSRRLRGNQHAFVVDHVGGNRMIVMEVTSWMPYREETKDVRGGMRSRSARKWGRWLQAVLDRLDLELR